MPRRRRMPQWAAWAGERVKCPLRRFGLRPGERAKPQMELMDRAKPAKGTPDNEGAAGLPPGTHVKMEPQSYCAYNQTRECFLGLKVTTGDLPSTHVAEMMLEKPLKSGEGVWMKP